MATGRHFINRFCNERTKFCTALRFKLSGCFQGLYRLRKVLESPEIAMFRFPVLEKGIDAGKPWKSPGILKLWSWKFYFLVQVSLTREEIHCNTLCAFGLVYCNAVTSKTDLVCELFDLMQPCLWTECILESPWKRVFESWKTLEFGLCKSWKVLVWTLDVWYPYLNLARAIAIQLTIELLSAAVFLNVLSTVDSCGI